MKLLLQVVVTIIVCFLLQYFFPWWAMAVGAGGTGYFFARKGFLSFLAGFTAIGLLWFGMAMATDMATHSVLTQKVNQVLPVNAFILATLIGGLVGGFASLTGSLLNTSK